MSNGRISDRWALGIALGTLLLAGCSHEAADWKQAGLANSAEAYQAFLQQYPRSPEATEAQTRIKQLAEQRDWQIAGATDTRDAYQQFVTQHPDSKWAQEARLRIENFAQAGVTGGTATATPAAQATSAASAAPTTPVAPGRLASREAVHRGSPAAPTHLRAGGRVVQLGAFRSKARAESEWRLLSGRFSTLRSLKPRYIAIRSRTGRMYRLQVQLASPAAAQGLCATLKKHARACVR